MGRALIRIMLVVSAGCALGGCHFFHGLFGGGRGPESPSAEQIHDWRDIATEADRNRLRDLRAAWIRALDQARAGGHAAEIAALGPLADPDAVALPGPLPPGSYRCRTIKLGAKSAGMLDYIAYPAFDCALTTDANGRLVLAKLTGSQRQKGMLWPDSAGRMVFLGTMELGDEQAPIAYGIDSQRNVAGVLERVAPNRWRLALPWPQWESNLDLIELVPQGGSGL